MAEQKEDFFDFRYAGKSIHELCEMQGHLRVQLIDTRNQIAAIERELSERSRKKFMAMQEEVWKQKK